MVDWKDPTIIALQFFGVVKVSHFLAGVFAWEILSTFPFEFQVYTGRRPFRWPFLLYIGSRFFTSASLITMVVGFDLIGEIHCEGWAKAVFGLTYVAFSLNSVLLGLRTMAFWNFQLVISSIIILTILANIAFLIRGVFDIHAIWDPTFQSCIPSNILSSQINIIVSMATDIIMLLLMLAGLYRQKFPGALWKMLHRQGIIWIVVATIGQIPAVLLQGINFNDAMNLIFLTPAFIILTICTTSMYRDLNVFVTPVANQRNLEVTTIEIGLPDPPSTSTQSESIPNSNKDTLTNSDMKRGNIV
ncbi:hypothetical protein BDQ12DRAFT_687825 [Crucibulum laeve]|uniref:Integral membrane protein n=1 Tax=Crucibulum laeve TaxID=68775 RepID=A0A5C3LT18_9AGAR|nr:hypothetical protein BDQ12DRAFT_687825 [Crucibulum laeve]